MKSTYAGNHLRGANARAQFEDQAVATAIKGARTERATRFASPTVQGGFVDRKSAWLK